MTDLTPDELTVLRYYDLQNREYDIKQDADNSPWLKTRKAVIDKGLLDCNTLCTYLTPAGRAALKEAGK